MKNILTNLMTSAVLLIGSGSGLEDECRRLRDHQPGGFARDCDTGQDQWKRYIPPRHPDINAKSVSRLVFHRYGDRYLLTQIDAPGVRVDRLPVSAAEKEAPRSEEAREVATVYVDIRPAGN